VWLPWYLALLHCLLLYALPELPALAPFRDQLGTFGCAVVSPPPLPYRNIDAGSLHRRNPLVLHTVQQRRKSLIAAFVCMSMRLAACITQGSTQLLIFITGLFVSAFVKYTTAGA
jgi:hypothetical protein